MTQYRIGGRLPSAIFASTALGLATLLLTCLAHSASSTAGDVPAAQIVTAAPDAASSSDSIAYAGTASHAFGTVDLKTGVFKQLGDTGLLLAGMGVANGKLYAVGYQSGTLYTVNTVNGALTVVGKASISYSLFGSTTGEGLFGGDSAGQLYSIDPATGNPTLIGPMGVAYAGYWGMSTNSPVLYFANDTNLYTLDVKTGAATLVGSMGSIRVGGLVLEDNVLWAGQESPTVAVATVNATTGAAKTGAAFTGIGSGVWWAIAPSPIPPVLTSTSLKSSATSTKAGTAISFTALVTGAAGTTTPAGTASFIDGSKTLSTVTLNATGQATYSTSALAVGAHSITAKYLGSSSDKSSTSNALDVEIEGVPSATLSATSLAFGSETVNQTSSAKVLTVSNGGSAILTLSAIKLSGSQADDFVMTKTCGSTLAVNASCTVSVKFAPVTTGAKTASISISDNATGSPQTVALSGTGVAAGSSPAVKLSASSLTFTNQATKTTSSAKSVTVTNSGTGALSITGITLVGGQADDFTLSKSCGSTLAAGASCTISVTFTPVSTGVKSASISIADNASGSPQTVSVSGTGVSGSSSSSVKSSATSIAFAKQKAKTTSAAKSVTLTNNGSSSVSITGITLTGSQADDFASSNTCGSTLAPGASCMISVTFKPVSTGAKVASIAVADNASGSPQEISLDGTGD